MIGDEFTVTIKLQSPKPVTEEQAKAFVLDAMGSGHYGYGPDNPFYGFDDETIKVVDITINGE